MYNFSLIFFLLFVPLSSMISGISPYDNSKIKCGTFADESELNSFISRIFIKIDTIKGRPKLSFSTETASGFFLIHYDTSGYHKVSVEDINKNKIPDYVELVSSIIDSIYKIEVEEIGYRNPENDSGLGGTNAYDIYLMNIGHDLESKVYYGVTRLDFQVKSNAKFPKIATHTIIDNDYGPFDSTGSGESRKQTFSEFGEPILKVTLAHEFHHAIQFAYGDEDALTNSHILNEMSSTWMEYRCFPEVKDYIQYVETLFAKPEIYPFGAGDESNGYYWSIFGQYLYKNYKDKALLRTWELIGNGINCYLALDSSLKELGTNLESAWCDFSKCLYYTGSRASEKSFFDDAASYPDFSPKNKLDFTYPTLITSGTTQAFEMRALRILLPPQGETSVDTLDIYIANTDLFAATKNIPSNKDYSITCSNSSGNGFIEIENSGFFYKLTAANASICGKTFFILSKPVNYAFPNPFNDLLFTNLNFPVPEIASLNSVVVVRIYDSNMSEILSEKLNVINIKNNDDDELGKRVAEMSALQFSSFQNGIYIFTVEFGEEIVVGKFTLLR